MTTTCQIAVCNYTLEDLPDWSAYANKTERLVSTAKTQGSHLLLLSEYAGMEASAWITGTVAQQFAAIQTMLPTYLELFQTLARTHQIDIQPGTIPVKDGESYRNRAYFFSQHGSVVYQDKQFLTPSEKSLGLLAPGTDLTLIETDFGKVGIAICYDSEFPTLVHAFVKAGARLILVPSATETEYGYTRVAVSCRARAIENQCFVANAYLMGRLSHCDYLSDHVGVAGIYTPVDNGFPANGILAQSTAPHTQLIHATLDWSLAEAARHAGQTTNFTDLQQRTHFSV